MTDEPKHYCNACTRPARRHCDSPTCTWTSCNTCADEGSTVVARADGHSYQRSPLPKR